MTYVQCVKPALKHYLIPHSLTHSLTSLCLVVNCRASME